MSGASGVAVFSLAISALEYNDLTNYKAQAALNPVVIDGTIQISRKVLTIIKQDQIIVQCPIAACGFPGIYGHSGKEVQAHFKGSAIVKIKTNEAGIDTFALETDRRTISLKRNLWILAISTLAMLTLFILPKKAPNPAFRRTASGGR